MIAFPTGSERLDYVETAWTDPVTGKQWLYNPTKSRWESYLEVVTWSTLEGKPAEFPVEAHEHVLSDVTDAGTAAAATLIDDDTMATATAANIPSAESVKAYVDASSGGVTDHGALTGLADDDHSQYALADGSRGDFATTAQGDLADTAVQTSSLSTTGGNDKVPLANGSGNLQTGPVNNRIYDGVLGNITTGYRLNGFGDVGNIIIPDQQGLLWKDPADSANIFSLRHWRGHDAVRGETIIESAWRMAILGQGPIQFGHNDALPTSQCLHITCGSSTVNDTIKHSRAISWQTKRHNGGGAGVERTGYFTAQATSLTDNTESSVLRFAVVEGSSDVGSVEGFNGGGGTYTKGTSLGTDMAEFSSQGIWHVGSAPAFSTLTDGATITQTSSKYHAVQSAKVTLAGNRTLVISGPLAGMRGVIYVKQDTTGSRTLTLPTGSCTPPAWALSTAANTIDRLSWEYDGSFYYWNILKGLTEPLDTDAQIFLTATSITDDTIESAINNLVLSLKGASLWTRFRAIYPFVGATSAKHAVDLKATNNITDDAAWILATHDANGITGNGVTAYGKLGFGPDDVGTQDSLAMTVYCRTAQPTLNSMLVGAQTNGSHRAYIQRTKPGATDYVSVAVNYNAQQFITPSEDDFTGFIIASRTASNATFLRENGATNARTEVSTGVTTQNFYALAVNASGVASNFSNANLAFLGISDGLSTAEAVTLEGIVQTFETALSR